ncbi:MAG TPA: Ig-like domain-containing protein [Kofleriaceae bacterium]|nr:Ig-like domain-containing protein [Kofleriaceae bacterium]
MTTRALFVVALAAACGGHSQPVPQATGTGSGSGSALATEQAEGLDLRLSNGTQGAAAYDRGKLAPASKLSPADVAALLARVAALPSEPGDTAAFALRPGTTPPPRTGATVTSSFPPPPSDLAPPPASDAGKPLEVARYMPEGEVPLAPQLSVTFSQPMIAVTSQEDAAAVVPVKLDPQPKGRWRWIGTRTIVFDPDVRFPQATTYHVTIPAGTRSVSGSALGAATAFTFETPAPKLVAHYPDGGPQRLDAPIMLLFDQKIDPAAVLAHIKVTASAGWDGKPIAVHLIDDKEAHSDRALGEMLDAVKQEDRDGRWLAFRATASLPPAATIDVTVPAGTPSLEGPNKTKAEQSFSFETYRKLELEKIECGSDVCRPGMAWWVELDNPLDVDKFDDKQIAVAPALPELRVVPSGSRLYITGNATARTIYHVTVSGKLADDFGQTLGHDETRDLAVGDATPTFYGPSGVVVLDPSAKHPGLDFFSTNYDRLKVKLYKVAPADYPAFEVFLAQRWNHDHPPTMPGAKLVDELIKTAGPANQLGETQLDLARALAGSGLGHVVAMVEPSPWTESYAPPEMIAWVQSTHLAIDAHVDHDSLVAFVSDLATGKPVAHAEVELQSTGTRATTDDAGLATLPLGPRRADNDILIARLGDDSAFVAGYQMWKTDVGPGLAWYVIDDRKMYKPGEQVSLKGWLRVIDHAKHGDVSGIAGNVTSIAYKVFDQSGNQIGTGSAPVDPVGGFDTTFAIPKTPGLGYARVEMDATGRMTGHYTHSFEIQEFRRPEFEVTANASQGPFLVGSAGDVTVAAKYYAGGGLPGAAVQWSVSASQTSYTPPNRDGFVFGNWVPWWGYRGGYDEDMDGEGFRPRRRARPSAWSLAGKTDATGQHVLHLDFLAVHPAMPMSVTATASVTDLNHQQWTASSALIVHPSALYVGLRTKKPFVQQGTPFDIDVIGVDLDGKAAPGAKIDVVAARLDYQYKKGRYVEQEVEAQDCAVVAAADVVPCHFKTDKGGTYRVTATIVDDKGRANQSKLEFWVSGGTSPAAREVQQEQVQLIPDKKEYAPGDTAQLLVLAPFFPADGVVTWRRGGIVKVEKITLDTASKLIEVPIEDAMTPNIDVQVDVVGAAARIDDHGNPDPSLPKRPAYAVGAIDLPIPPKQRTLAVAVTPAAAKLGPGETTRLAIEVKDASGKPVANAETAVIVVDEAILSLTSYQFPDPIGSFYGELDTGTRDYYERAYVHLARPVADMLADANGKDLPTGGAAPGGGPYRALEQTDEPMDHTGEMDLRRPEAAPAAPASLAFAAKVPAPPPPKPGTARPPAPAIAVRSNFNPLAAFAPAVKTGADGRAVVEVKLPDNLTRYRIVAIAVAGERQFGKGESALTARLPLMVRPSPPRFLNFGDTFRLPVVVQNQTDAAMTVRLAVRTSNATLTDGAGREVTVPPNDRALVEFPAAAELAGTARFQIVASAGAASDAATVELPVWTPATTEAFATYGVIDGAPGTAIKQPVALPGKVVTQFGGLEVTASSTNLQALTDAMLYLVHYPYECAEQRSSRILAIATLKDVLAAFEVPDMPSEAQMIGSTAADIEHLSQMQNFDGGFAFWDRGYPSEPYLSVFVVNALVHAKAKGFAVPPEILDRARPYLASIEDHFPSYYPEDVRHAISAYALYTRKQMGDLDLAKGKRLLASAGGPDKLTMETDGWLLGLFAGNPAAASERKALVRYALDHVSETAGAANFTTSYGDGGYLLLASDRRVDGVMLESLILEDKTLDLIPKVVTGLLAHRTRGRWENTQENAFVLSALDLYFQTYEKTTPDFVARVWLGSDYAGDHAFRGHTTERAQIDVAMKDVATHDRSDLTIQKDGVGRLYYRIGMTYAPASLKLDPADYGFVVERRYEAVDDPKDVTRDNDGTWHVKAGARVRVRLEMVNQNRRYQVALVDPLPAGFEAMNPALAVTGPIPQDPGEQQSRGAYWWWYGTWYEHQNFRDERVEAFASLVWEGVHDYVYVARATTPGTFVVPPPKAEEMYMPETFGRGGSDRVIVE